MTLLNKEEAAERLGVAKRTLEEYQKQGRIKPEYQRGKRGQVAMYDTEAIDALKESLSEKATAITPRVARPVEAPTERERALLEMLSRLIPGGDLSHEDSRNAEIARLAGQADKPGHDLQQLALKETLTMAEAVALSGCSESHIRRGIDMGKIKADHNGPRGSLRLRRTDVLKYAREF